MKLLRKLAYLLVSAGLIFSLTGCGEGSSQSASTTATPAKQLTADEFSQLFSSPDKFKGSSVDFYAKAFNSPSVNGKPSIQAWADIENNDKSVLIESDYKMSQNEFIHVKGTVTGSAKGENAFGAELSAPTIGSATVEKASYIDAVSPTIKTIDVNKEIDQNGLVVKMQKIEIAKNETRLYFEVKNNSQNKASFYSFNSKIVQGDKQIEEASNYDADYKKIQSELLPGVKSDGIIAFKPIDQSAGKITVISEGRTDDYKVKFSPYAFDVTW